MPALTSLLPDLEDLGHYFPHLLGSVVPSADAPPQPKTLQGTLVERARQRDAGQTISAPGAGNPAVTPVSPYREDPFSDRFALNSLLKDVTDPGNWGGGGAHALAAAAGPMAGVAKAATNPEEDAKFAQAFQDMLAKRAPTPTSASPFEDWQTWAAKLPAKAKAGANSAWQAMADELSEQANSKWRAQDWGGFANNNEGDTQFSQFGY